MDEPPRRRVLRTGGTLLAAGLTTSLGGCLQGDGNTTPTDGDPTDDGSDDGSGGSLPAYAEWLPAPATLNTDHYEFTAVDPDAVFAHETAIQGSVFGDLSSLTAQLDGITMATLSGVYVIGGAFVMTGDIDADAFESSLTANGYTESESYQDYTLYTGGPGGTAAVSSDTAIRMGSLGDATGNVEAIVDAKRGAVDRYADASDDCRTLLSHLGSGAIAGGQTHDDASYLDGVVADGFSWRLDGRSASFSEAFVFERQSAVDTAAVADLVGETTFFDQFESPSVGREGRTAVVDGTTETGSVGRLGPDFGTSGTNRAPQVSFTFEYESRGDGAGVLTVQHRGGDAVTVSRLRLRGYGYLSAGAVPDTAPGELDVTRSGDLWPTANASGEIGSDAAVVAGDEVRLGVSSDAEVVLVWETGDTSAVLGQFQGPDA